MTDVRALVKTVLDSVLKADKIYSYWLQKAETTGENKEMYVVFTLGGDSSDDYADGGAITKTAGITIRFYCHSTMLKSATKQASAKAYEVAIINALNAAGIATPNGSFDVGDIEANGFYCIVIEGSYWRVE